MDPRDPTVIDEIASRLGPGDGTPFTLVDTLYGYLWRPEERGRWRLYRALDSDDYVEGDTKDVGKMVDMKSTRGDTVVYVRLGASLSLYQNGQLTAAAARQDVTSWHM
jgi:hypothetical protein